MGEESTAGGFRDVDRATRPETFVRYRDTVTGIEAVQAYNRRSYKLLLFRAGSFFSSLTGFGLSGRSPNGVSLYKTGPLGGRVPDPAFV